MKVGILTFPNSQSYGASLQMIALYKTIVELGFSAEIINYKNSFMKNRKHVPSKENKLIKLVRRIKNFPKANKFRKFEHSFQLFPHREIDNLNDLKQIAERYDYVIVGSDQVWNPKVTGCDYSYFLDFITEKRKKIAYAPSFGVIDLEKNNAEKIARLLNEFAFISVRESAGCDIVKSLIGKTCPVVLDPTMLRAKEEWKSLEKEIANIPNQYILNFTLNNVEYVKNFTENLSLETGLPIVNICGKLSEEKCKVINAGLCGPREWLYLMDHSRYVITDSFHGTVFSIIFEKQNFISLASSTNSRLKTLLNTFVLMNRAIKENSSYGDYAKIDYTKVNAILKQKRELSKSFLMNALGVIDAK